MVFERGHKLDYYKVAARLSYNALRFRTHKVMNIPLKPAALSLAVTNRCNSHCIMCNIWKSARENAGIKQLELSAGKIIEVLSSRLFSGLVELDLTGGEPHLRDDLVEIACAIARLKKGPLPDLKSIIITSNGFLTERVISNYRKILDSIKNTGIDLVAVTSIDGIGDIHDFIRRTGNAFELASGTISGLMELKKEYPDLILGIKTTVLPFNIDSLDSILNFALSRNLFHIISPVFFTRARFKNMDSRESLAIRTEDTEKLRGFYRCDELKTGYFYGRALDYLATGKRQWVCTALYNYLFIDYEGKVYPCELLPEAIGNVNNEDIIDVWNGPPAREWRKKTGNLEFCGTCIEPGAIRYGAIAGGAGYKKFLKALGKRDYDKSLRGEGFSKYLGI